MDISEDLTKSRIDLTGIAEPVLPTIEEHDLEVRRIVVVCASSAAGVALASVVGVVLAIRSGVPLQTIAFAVPVVMAIVLVTFGIGYAIPIGLIGMKRLGLSIRMGYESLRLNREMKKTLDRELAPIKMKQRQTTTSP